ncbi:hypothetical protein [Pseudoduganella sp. HUAS MS19]
MQEQYSLATADETRTTDGYVYNVSVKEVPDGFQAQLVWISMPAERMEHLDEAMTTTTFHSARAAIVEAHSLALERILAWREPSSAHQDMPTGT